MRSARVAVTWTVGSAVAALVAGTAVSAYAQHGHPIAVGSFRGFAVVENEIVVKPRASADRARLRGEVERVEDVDATEAIGGGDVLLFHSRSRSTETLVRNVTARADVEYVEPNFVLHAVNVPNDTHFATEWALQNTGQVVNNQIGIPGADISAVPAWDVTTGSRANAVAVIDTGIDYNHPDLAANVWSAPADYTVTVGGVQIGCPAGSHGFNVLTNTCDPLDDNNHGTHCAGIVGAVGNDAYNICGVNWTASIVGIKLLDAGGNGTSANAVNAIEFAVQLRRTLGADANVRVLSNSYGNFPFSQALLDEIVKAGHDGMLFVAAAGNNGSDNDAIPFYPASYATPSLVAVAATNAADVLWGFSNYGATSVHLGAPGVNVISTIRNGGYAFFNGTSMAAPHVAGAAALMLAANPALAVDQLRAGLLATVDPLADLAGVTSTGGRLNVDGAVHWALAPVDFSLDAGPPAQSVLVGDVASYTANVVAMNGFAEPVTLDVTGLPAGAMATFTPASVVGGGGSSTLDVVTSASTPPGSYALTITGTSPSFRRSTTVTLVVTSPADFTLDAFPTSVTVKRKGYAVYRVKVGSTGGFGGIVTFAVSGLPAASSAAFVPSTVTGTGSTFFAVITTQKTPPGTYAVSVQGLSGSSRHETTVGLTVRK